MPCQLLKSLLLVFVSLQLSTAKEPITFDHHVMPVLSRAGCNSGSCHGNLNGKGGFRLSLRGQDAFADFLAITQDLSGRRVNRIHPQDSLLLLKPTASAPHQGGQRFTVDSDEYHILSEWIQRGSLGPDSQLARLVELNVVPNQQTVMAPDDSVKLRVMAKFSNGSTRDVTNLAAYETSNFNAAVDLDGTVQKKRVGETQVIVRYLQKQVPVRVAFIENRRFQWKRPYERNYVDKLVFKKLRSLRLNPVDVVSDHVFLRRAYLDTLGIIPTADEAQAFVHDASIDKREKLIDHLLGRPEFADLWAQRWCDVLRVEERVLDENGTKLFHEWIRNAFGHGKPLNEFAAQILNAKGSTYEVAPSNFYRALRTPLDRGESVARVFLGYRLQCAKCHNHPFDQWTQDDYYSWAACFSQVDYEIIENKRKDKFDKKMFNGEQIVKRKVPVEFKNARTGEQAQPAILNNGVDDFKIQNQDDFLTDLSSWMANNRQFARAQVNRIWYYLMGRGLVDPIDDFRVTNPASHPQLLEQLVDEFLDSDWDVRTMVRRIMRSNTYQLASAMDEPSELEVENYATNHIRRLTAEQLLDAQCRVLGVTPEFNGYDPGIRAGQLPGVSKVFRDKNPSRDDRFLTKFGKPPRIMACECERSDEPNLSQVFMLISDKELERRMRSSENQLGIDAQSSLNNVQIITRLYWSAVGREPTAQELAVVDQWMGAGNDRFQVLQDIAWALLNSKEFVFRY